MRASHDIKNKDVIIIEINIVYTTVIVWFGLPFHSLF